MINFFKNRWNKDNFWNLMFFVVLVGGTVLAFATGVMIISWFAIASSIWIIKSRSNIKFDKETKIFIINEEKQVKASGNELIVLTLLSFGVITITGFIADSCKVDASPAILCVLGSFPILFLTLYCIIRDFPIAVYFKKDAWIGSGLYTNINKTDHKLSKSDFSEHFMHPSNFYRDIRNSSIPGNVCYRKPTDSFSVSNFRHPYGFDRR